MARIILVYDSFSLKFAVLELYQQSQIQSGDVQVAQHWPHIFITRFNSWLRGAVAFFPHPFPASGYAFPVTKS